MKNRSVVRILSLCMILLIIPVAVFPADYDEEALSERDLARVRKKVEALRAWQLTEELDLDQETSAKLFPAMKETDDSRWRIESENRAIMGEIARLIREKRPETARLNTLLDRLQANRMDLARVEDRHLTRVRGILSPEDFVRYLMFQIRFQRQIREKAALAFRERNDPSSENMERNRSGSDRRSGGGGSEGGRR